MRVLTRYILIELLVVLMTTLASLTLFVFLVLIGKEAVENGLGLGPIVRMLPYMLPQAMQFAVPGALLLATTSVYGRVAANNEIVAIKALGISPLRLIWPGLALGCLVSFAAVALNDLAVSWGREGVQQVVLDSLEEIAYGRLRTVRSFKTAHLQVNVRGVEGNRLIQPIIQFTSGDGGPPDVITADEGVLAASSERNAVAVTLHNADGDVSGWNVVHPGEFKRWFSLEEFTGRSSSTKSPSSYALREIGPAKQAQALLLEHQQQKMAADAGYALLLGRMEELSAAAWRPREHQLANARRTQYRLYTEPHRRWTNGFSCLGFAMIGAPMAVLLRRGEFWGSFFACFLPILLGYYPMLVGCVDRAKDGAFPPHAVWLGNLVLAGVGLLLIRRVVRF
jgi:lipopolysaccharide export system permease protein